MSEHWKDAKFVSESIQHLHSTKTLLNLTVRKIGQKIVGIRFQTIAFLLQFNCKTVLLVGCADRLSAHTIKNKALVAVTLILRVLRVCVKVTFLIAENRYLLCWQCPIANLTNVLLWFCRSRQRPFWIRLQRREPHCTCHSYNVTVSLFLQHHGDATLCHGTLSQGKSTFQQLLGYPGLLH